MISKLRYLPVNWMNGMAFSESHLNSQNLAITDGIRDASALHLTHANYGLLGGAYQKKFADSYRDNITNEKVEVSYCRAITQDGSRIEILNQGWEELNTNLSVLSESLNLETSKDWYILLVIDSFTRIPEGEDDTGKGPRRKSNTRPAFQLVLMSLADLQLDNLANAIPIAKFEGVATGLRKVEDYIPSCSRVNSHEKLMIKYEQYGNILNNLKIASQNIMTKIKHKRSTNDSGPLAEDIYKLSERYLNFFVKNYDQYKYSIPNAAPIKLVEFFAKLARIFDHSMNMANDKSHVLQYFKHYATDVTESQLNEIIQNTFESKYYHFDIGLTLVKTDRFLETINEIFTRLEKLEYRDLVPKGLVKKDRFSGSNVPKKPNVRVNPKVHITPKNSEQNLGEGLKE